MEILMRIVVRLVEAYALYFVVVFLVGMIVFAPGIVRLRKESKRDKEQ